MSGLPTDRFCFEGFLPRRGGARRAALEALATEARTMVFFEAPHRTRDTLAAMAEAFGPDRPAAVCRELTKTWEQVRRGGLGELVEWAEHGVLGEVTLVVGGRTAATGADLASAVAQVLQRTAAGERLKDVCADVAGASGLSSRVLYAEALARR